MRCHPLRNGARRGGITASVLREARVVGDISQGRATPQVGLTEILVPEVALKQAVVEDAVALRQEVENAPAVGSSSLPCKVGVNDLFKPI
jgi:hypothetical protein